MGRSDTALAAARKALELHPYDPDAFRLMAILADDPAVAERFREAYEHVMDRATRGFQEDYPRLEPSLDWERCGVLT